MSKNNLFGYAITILCLVASMDTWSKQEKVWSLDGFESPESAFFDKARATIYVSNINGEATAKDGNGYISRVSLDGQILERHWVTGLDGPKGLVSDGKTLYVADIDRLVAINIDKGEISGAWEADGAIFLNDTAVDLFGHVYVSDTVGSRIYVLKNNKLASLVDGVELLHPNGLNFLEDRLYVAPWGAGMKDDWSTESGGYLYTIDPVSGDIGLPGSRNPIGSLDGLEPDGKGNWVVSDWIGGNIYRVNKNGSSELLLNLNQGAADIEYIVDQSLIIVPMMLDNTLEAYKIQ